MNTVLQTVRLFGVTSNNLASRRRERLPYTNFLLIITKLALYIVSMYS